jgi:hypothetical protein
VNVSSPLIADLKGRQQKLLDLRQQTWQPSTQQQQQQQQQLPGYDGMLMNSGRIAHLQMDINSRIKKGNKIGSASQRAAFQAPDATASRGMKARAGAEQQLEPPDLLKLLSDSPRPLVSRASMLAAGPASHSTDGAAAAQLKPWSGPATNVSAPVHALQAYGQHANDYVTVHNAAAAQNEHEAGHRPLRSLGPVKVEMLSTTVPPSPDARKNLPPPNTPVKGFELQQGLQGNVRVTQFLQQQAIIERQPQAPSLHRGPIWPAAVNDASPYASVLTDASHAMLLTPRRESLDSGLPRFLV